MSLLRFNLNHVGSSRVEDFENFPFPFSLQNKKQNIPEHIHLTTNYHLKTSHCLPTVHFPRYSLHLQPSQSSIFSTTHAVPYAQTCENVLTSLTSKRIAIIAFPPLCKHSPIILSAAEFLEVYIKLVKYLISPPTIDLRNAPMSAPQLRDRTVIPYTAPRIFTTRKPGTSFIVDVMTHRYW